MKRLSSPKACAAVVIICFLAVLVSLWAMTDAGRKAVAAASGEAVAASDKCVPKDIEGRVAQLQKSEEVPAVLDNDCIRGGVEAQVHADLGFLIAYSALTLALFLFVRALRGGGWALLVVGALLSLAMAAGDVFENHHTLDLLSRVEEGSSTAAPLKLLQYGGWLKWGALVLSAAVLGALWPLSRRLAWAPKILALASAAVILAGLALPGWKTLAASVYVLGFFWLAALIHAVAVMVDREQYLGKSAGGPKS